MDRLVECGGGLESLPVSELQAKLQDCYDIEERRRIRAAIRNAKIRALEAPEPVPVDAAQGRPSEPDCKAIHCEETPKQFLAEDGHVIDSEDRLRSLLYSTSDYEEKKKIRAAIRELRKKKGGTSDVALSDASTSSAVSPTASVAAPEVVTTYTRSRGDQHATSGTAANAPLIADRSAGVDFESTEAEVFGKGRQRPDRSPRKETSSADEPKTYLTTKAESECKMNGSTGLDCEGKSFGEQAPCITRPLQDIRFMDGSQCVTLSLEFHHSDSPIVVSWFKDDDLLTSCDDFEQVTDDVSCRLIIRELFPDDAGVYKCIIRNKFGEATSSAQLTVDDNPSFKPPEFVVVPRDTTVEAGNSLEVHVEIRGSPEPSLSWYKDNNVLLNGKECRLTLNSGVGTLLIYDVTLNDDGVYKCLASNAAGESEACFSVRVHAHHAPSYGAPKLSALLEDLTVPDGSSCVTLSCALESRASFATVSWYRGSKKLRNSKDFLQTFDGLKATLVIAEIYPDDAGIYKCVLAVGNTELTSEATLTVTAGSSAEESCDDSDAGDHAVIKSPSARSTISAELTGSSKSVEQGEIKRAVAAVQLADSVPARQDAADQDIRRKELATCNGITSPSDATPLSTQSSLANGLVTVHTGIVQSQSINSNQIKATAFSADDTRSDGGAPAVLNGASVRHSVGAFSADLANARHSGQSLALSSSITVGGASANARLSPSGAQSVTADVTDCYHPVNSPSRGTSPGMRSTTAPVSSAATEATGSSEGQHTSSSVGLENSSCAPSTTSFAATRNLDKACSEINTLGSAASQHSSVCPALTTAKSKTGEKAVDGGGASRCVSSSIAASRANPIPCPAEPIGDAPSEPGSQKRCTEAKEHRRFGPAIEKSAQDAVRAAPDENSRVSPAPISAASRSETGSVATSLAADRLRTSQPPTTGSQQTSSVSARAERFRKAEKDMDAAAPPVPRPFVSSKVFNNSQKQSLVPSSLGNDKPTAESASGRISPQQKTNNLLESRGSLLVETCSPTVTGDATGLSKDVPEQASQNGRTSVLHPTDMEGGVAAHCDTGGSLSSQGERSGRSVALTNAAIVSGGVQTPAAERTPKDGAAHVTPGPARTAGEGDGGSRSDLPTAQRPLAAKAELKSTAPSVLPSVLILPDQADSNNNYATITDENQLQKLLDKTEDFDERKKIRARIREVKELRKAERENEFRRREEERVAQERKRMADAELAKKEKLDKYREFSKSSIGALPVASDEMAKQKITEAEKEKKRLLESTQAVSTSTTFAGCGSKADEALKLKLEAAEKSKEAALKSFESVAKKEADSKKDPPKSAAPTSLKPVDKKPPGTTAVTKPAGGKVAPATGKQALAAFKQMDKANNPNAGQSRPKLGGDSKLMQVADALLRWCRFMTKGYENINIENYTTSWNDGMAFCALIHHFYPDAFDYSALDPKNRRHNFTLAFETAEQKAGITQLLDVEDMVRMMKPDWKCVLTYIQTFYSRIKELDDAKAQTPTGGSAAAISAVSGSD